MDVQYLQARKGEVSVRVEKGNFFDSRARRSGGKSRYCEVGVCLRARTRK